MGILDALLEDLVGEPLVSQGPRDLERPDHQGEDTDEYPGGRRAMFADPWGNILGVYRPSE